MEMGFEALIALKKQLQANAKQQLAGKQQDPARRKAPEQSKKATRAKADPALLAIARLQQSYPAAFPKKPGAKLPLKKGVFEDLKVQTAHGLAPDALKLALSVWCQGMRYWKCLKDGAERVDLTGAPCGQVTAAEAQRARQFIGRHVRTLRSSRHTSATPEDATPVVSVPPPPPTRDSGR
ncbi:ProQ/FinO family protein [Bordetella ansorpii]|nr:ProQ/FinO family protein [Bordetella ansorpii]